jgi:hypothetical protein
MIHLCAWCGRENAAQRALLNEGWILCFEPDGSWSAQPPAQQEWQKDGEFCSPSWASLVM